ncbi:MAG: hypothetical protein ACRENK_16030 [Gemmatimonadaceae bacterium]
MKQSAINAVSTYVESLRLYTEQPDAEPFYSSRTDRVVRTIAEPNAPRLPVTGQPIRGHDGVTVTVSEASQPAVGRESILALLNQAIPFSASGPSPSKEQSPPQLARAVMHHAFLELRDTLFAQEDLALRLADGWGYKTYEPWQLADEIRRSREGAGLTEVLALTKFFERGLPALGAEATPAALFSRWTELGEVVIAELTELESRSQHAYTAYAFLNGPLIDLTHSFELASTETGDRSTVFIQHATDLDLAKVVEGFGYAAQLPLGFHNCNTLLRLPLFVPVLGQIIDFENLYAKAAEIFARALDIFRIVRGTDLGIAGIIVESTQLGTQGIRPTYHTRYNQAYGPYLPHRVAFGRAEASALTEDELASVTALFRRHLRNIDIKGFPVALRRFRDTWERHWPESEERLLDIAIALEALFLNDGQDKELRHRLALRVARFLERPGEARMRTFMAIRRLYDWRSKVAHGADLQSVNARDREQLSQTLVEAPSILRRSMAQFINGDGPVALDKDFLASYWRNVELS